MRKKAVHEQHYERLHKEDKGSTQVIVENALRKSQEASSLFDAGVKMVNLAGIGDRYDI